MDVRIVAANVANAATKAPNLNSVVVFITCGFTTFLLMGESFVETEKWIISEDEVNMNVLKDLLDKGDSVLKVGHHGSGTSTGDDWVKWTQPTAAFISSDTQLFGKEGTSTCVASVISRLLNLKNGSNYVLADGGKGNTHQFIQYDTNKKCHNMMTTTRWLYTTLVRIELTGTSDANGRALFKADGVPLYYTIDDNGTEWVGFGTGQSSVSKRYG